MCGNELFEDACAEKYQQAAVDGAICRRLWWPDWMPLFPNGLMGKIHQQAAWRVGIRHSLAACMIAQLFLPPCTLSTAKAIGNSALGAMLL